MSTAKLPPAHHPALSAVAAATWPGAYVRLAFGRDFILFRPQRPRICLGKGMDAALKRLRLLVREERP